MLSPVAVRPGPSTFRTVNLKNGVQRSPEYLAVNRYGQVPALRHRGLTVVQSNVILDYLARATGCFEGATEQAALDGAGMALLGIGCRHQCRQGAALQHASARWTGGHGLFPAAGRRPRWAYVDAALARWAGLAGRRRPQRSPISAAGAAWSSWRRRGSRSPAGRSCSAGPRAWRRCPASRLPYRPEIPKRDTEFAGDDPPHDRMAFRPGVSALRRSGCRLPAGEFRVPLKEVGSLGQTRSRAAPPGARPSAAAAASGRSRSPPPP